MIRLVVESGVCIAANLLVDIGRMTVQHGGYCGDRVNGSTEAATNLYGYCCVEGVGEQKGDDDREPHVCKVHKKLRTKS